MVKWNLRLSRRVISKIRYHVNKARDLFLFSKVQYTSKKIQSDLSLFLFILCINKQFLMFLMFDTSF